MDMLGHVNNTAQFRYMEQARIEWVHALSQGRGDDDGQRPVIANASCNSGSPVVHPAAIEVRMYIGDPGRTSAGAGAAIVAPIAWSTLAL